jgi:DNA repair photolyase
MSNVHKDFDYICDSCGLKTKRANLKEGLENRLICPKCLSYWVRRKNRFYNPAFDEPYIFLFDEEFNKKGTDGTNEWSPRSLNIYYGCPNNCKYCYAKNIWERFRKEKGGLPEKWCEIVPNQKIINKGFKKVKTEGKHKFDYMFPTSHDIVESNLKDYLKVLNKILKVGNSVLITTKPNFECIKEICSLIIKNDYQEQVEFMMTITSLNHKLLDEYEPNAPGIQERLDSLVYVYKNDIVANVSIEPFLDRDPIPLIKAVQPWASTIWLGVMSGKKYEYHNLSNLKKIIHRINTIISCDSELRQKLRLKDGLRNKGFYKKRIKGSYLKTMADDCRVDKVFKRGKWREEK